MRRLLLLRTPTPIRHINTIRLRLQWLALISNPLPTLEKLRPIHQPPLVIYPPIDEIRIIERQLRRAIDNVIGGLNPQHEAMILIPNLVSPASETAAGIDVFSLEPGEELCEDAFALECGGRVAVIETAVVG